MKFLHAEYIKQHYSINKIFTKKRTFPKIFRYFFLNVEVKIFVE